MYMSIIGIFHSLSTMMHVMQVSYVTIELKLHELPHKTPF